MTIVRKNPDKLTCVARIGQTVNGLICVLELLFEAITFQYLEFDFLSLIYGSEEE